ncbi:MAG: GGDEF domain-containing protein [Bauldia sp.]|nr:GGDEF domain-containing protein [Bauldia sp.]
MFAITAAYFFAAAFELWRGRDERLFARWPLMALLLVHSAPFVGGVIEAAMGTLEPMRVPPLTTWFGLIHFEGIGFSIGTAVFVVAFIRERREARQRLLAEVDELTGTATRRALLERADEAVEEFLKDGKPLSIAIFDLDHFKSVNDRFGHAMGDEVLRRFGGTVRGMLRRGDYVGRLGGEEFALLMTGTGLADAIAVADRIRVTFEVVTREVDGVAVGCTVSAGVAAASGRASARSLLIAADDGLYRAKSLGRNRVERPSANPNRNGRPVLNRVA